MAAAQDYLSGLQYGAPGGGVGVNADKMNPEFAARMAALIQAAEKATGDKVSIFEGYRDPARSAQLRADYKGVPVKYDGKTYQPTPGMEGKYRAAAPGVSEHNYGMASDIRAGKNPDKYPSGPAYDYMVKHAADFGLHWFGASDPAHFEIPPNEYKQALAGKPLQPFKNYNPAGLTPPMNIPQVGTALDVIDKAVPRASGSSVASAYAAPPVPRNRPIAPTPPPLPVSRPKNIDNGGFNMAPPNLPFNSALPANRGAAYGPNTGQWGPTVAQLGMQAFPPSIPASGRAVAVPQSVGIHGAASLTAPAIDSIGNGPQWGDLAGMLGSGAPVPMPGRPATLSASAAPVPMPGRPASLAPSTRPSTAPQQASTPRKTVTVQPLPSSYTINPDAVIGKAKQAGVISGPASWLPNQTIWDGALGQQGMRDRIAAGLPQGSSLDPKTNTVHVADPQALANEYLGKVPSLFRPMAREAVIPALHYAESAGYVKPQWPAAQTFPLPVPRPATPAIPAAPVRAPTLQDALTEQLMMRRTTAPSIYPPVNLNRPGRMLPASYAFPVSRPASFFAQPQVAAPRVAAPVAVAPQRTAAPSQSNGGGYFGGQQNAINDTLRTLGFNV